MECEGDLFEDASEEAQDAADKDEGKSKNVGKADIKDTPDADVSLCLFDGY